MNSLSCQTELGARTVNSGALRLGASSAASQAEAFPEEPTYEPPPRSFAHSSFDNVD